MARPKKTEGEVKDQRVPIVMSPSELQRLDDWMHTNRIRSRGDAIRRLCEIGMLVDLELEQVADGLIETLNGVTRDFREAVEEHREIVNERTADVLFTQEHVSDIMEAAIDRQMYALDSVESTADVLLAIYNAILALVSAETLASGSERSKSVLVEANKVIKQNAARIRDREDSRYLAIHITSLSEAEREAYEALPDEDKGAYLEAAIENLKLEEAKDSDAFHARHSLKPFWEEKGWLNALPRLADLKSKG